MSEQIRIESGSRWDTLDLVSRLPRCRWYLVERRSHFWEIHLEAPSPARRAELLEAAEKWARDRRVDSVVHLPRTKIRLRGGSARREEPPAAAEPEPALLRDDDVDVLGGDQEDALADLAGANDELGGFSGAGVPAHDGHDSDPSRFRLDAKAAPVGDAVR